MHPKEMDYVCSECDELFPRTAYHTFCPDCGKIFCPKCSARRALEDHDCAAKTN